MTRIIGVLEQELKSAGAWVVSGRLHQAAAATVVRLADGGVVTTDGPFVESKEHLGGFYLIQAEDLDGALGWVSRVTGAIGCRSRFVRSWDSRPDRVGDGDAAGRPDGAEVGRTFGEESGRSLAALIRAFGGIDLAEDAVREAFAVALGRWPGGGVPPNPGGWITRTARNQALDRRRREARGRELLGEVAVRWPGGDDPGVPQQGGRCPTTGCGSSSPAATRPCPPRRSWR